MEAGRGGEGVYMLFLFFFQRRKYFLVILISLEDSEETWVECHIIRWVELGSSPKGKSPNLLGTSSV